MNSSSSELLMYRKKTKSDAHCDFLLIIDKLDLLRVLNDLT